MKMSDASVNPSLQTEFIESASHPLIPLSASTLNAVRDLELIDVPTYPLDKRTAGVVHFAYGNFAAAHIGDYHNDLLEKGVMNAGIIGVIPRIRRNADGTCDALKRRDALKAQDYLYTIREKDRTTDRTRVVGSLMDILVGPDDREAVYELMASPDIKLITGTVTQKGYDYDFKPEDREDQFANYIVEGLARRYTRGMEPFCVMSCDNIQENGAKLKRLVITLAAQKKDIIGLKNWIEDNVVFYDTMVDRITPSITEESCHNIQNDYGVIDCQTITTEPGKELVIGIKDDQAPPPFPYDTVGATYTDNVGLHEAAKLRMLNGSHMYIGVTGRVGGEVFIEDALDKPKYLSLTQEFMRQVKGTLEPTPSRNYDVYGESLIERFRNPHQKDELQRLARNGIDKVETRFFVPLEIAYEKGEDHDQIISGIAHWVAYLAKSNTDKTLRHDGDGFFIEDEKAYNEGYVDVAKSLNGSIAPVFSLPIFSRMADSRHGETFRRELQQAWTDLHHPGNDNLNPASRNDRNALVPKGLA